MIDLIRRGDLNETDKESASCYDVFCNGFCISCLGICSAFLGGFFSFPSDKSGDTEVSTIAVSDPSVGHMEVTLYTMTNGYDSVRAWGEKSSFGHPNVSDPYDVISLQYQGINWNIYYYSSADIEQGDNIILNLDNPIYTEVRPIVTGRWTPN